MRHDPQHDSRPGSSVLMSNCPHTVTYDRAGTRAGPTRSGLGTVPRNGNWTEAEQWSKPFVLLFSSAFVRSRVWQPATCRQSIDPERASCTRWKSRLLGRR
jgi:hypothetical protein